jgi:glycosyltransferase involved in cell wall biosynthesis
MGAAAPSLTVCIPTQGRPSLVEVALPSLLPQLGPDDQVVVAFHGTTPVAAVAALDPRIDVVRHDGPTVGTTRNAAAAAARGDVLVFLDDDDELVPGALRSVRRTMSDRSVTVGSGVVERVTDAGAVREPPRPGDELQRGVTARFLAGAFAVRRDAFEAVDGYDPRLRFSENHELSVRLVHHAVTNGTRICASDDLWLRYRPSRTSYAAARVEAVDILLATHGHLLPRRSRTRADLHAIASVQHHHLGHAVASRRAAWRAVRAWPAEPRHLGRALARSLPSPSDLRGAGRRIRSGPWRRSSPPA